MGLHTKAYLLGLFMMVVSSWAAALGLGEIKLNSVLNQPLDAEIELINVRDLTEREIIVGLGAKADFDRAGVDLTYFLTLFDFSVDLEASGGPIIKIKTNEPVKEPFLNFIIFSQWPSGKLFREFTLLVDLPVFSGAKAEPVRVVSRPPAQVAVVKQPIQRQPEPEQLNRELVESTAPTYDSEVYGPVGSNDTLWAIAKNVRPDSSYTVQQTMLAIQRLNPKAFINNNINLLRRGQVLRVPTGEQINQLSSRDAISEVAGQNNSWNSESFDESEESGAQLEGSKNFAETKAETGDIEGRVKLSAASTTGDTNTAQGMEDAEEGTGLVSEQLDVAQEELDAADREKSDLENRLSSIDEQIETMEKLVEVSSEELRALELASQQVNDAEPEIVESEIVESEVAEQSEADTTEETATEVVSVVDEPVETATPVEQANPEQSMIDILMENITYVIAALGGLVVCVVLFLFFRNRDDGFDDDFDDELENMASFGDGMDDGLHDPEEVELPEGEDDTEVLNETDTSTEDQSTAEAETEDVVGECDIHLAYGQFDQAEEKLLRALDKEPGNALVRLKLMEVLAAQGDAESFDSHYAKLLVLDDQEVSNRAAVLREGVINIGDYDASKYDTSDFKALIGLSEPESSVDESSSQIEEPSVEGDVDLSGDSLDFEAAEALDSTDTDLDLGEDDTQIAPFTAAQNPSETEKLDDLALNLDLGSSDDSVADDVLADESPDLSDLDEPALDEADLEIDLDASLDDLDLGGLDLDLSGSDLDDSDLDDLELGDDLADAELSFDADDLDDDLLTTQPETLSSEFSENLVADASSSPVSDDMDFSSLDESLELDLTADSDLENTEDAGMSELSSDDSLEDLAGLDIDDEQLDGLSSEESMDDFEVSLDEGPALPLEDTDLSVESSEPEALEGGDFDVAFDLENNLDLDELDNELDELAAESSSIDSDVDADDIDLELASPELVAQPDSEELDSADIDGELGLTNSSDSLDDLQLEAANEVGSELEDLPETSEFDANSDFEIPDFDPENDDDSNLDFLSDNDETATKLDLARAYIDMGDADGAKDILDEILEEGDDGQKKDAQGLLKKLA